MRCLGVVLVAALLAAACTAPTSPEPPPGAIRVTGTVLFYPLEGGFWVVRGDDGVTYDPLNGLPPAFMSENVRVLLIAKVRTDLAGIHMVGPTIEILQIQRL